MSLQSILEIVLESLTPEERRGFAVAEEIYKMQGCPVEREQLRTTMEVIIKECVKRNLRYGRAFLKQFKRLERGEWAPAGVNNTSCPHPTPYRFTPKVQAARERILGRKAG